MNNIRIINPFILIYCPNGYLLEESFVPLIKNLYCINDIYLLLGSYYFSELHLGIATNLKESGVVKNIFYLSSDEYKIFSYHKEIASFCNKFLNYQIKALILIDDNTITSRYLIHAVKKNNGCSIVLNISTNWPLLKKYYTIYNPEKLNDVNTLDSFIQQKISSIKSINFYKLINFIFSKLLQRVKLFTRIAFNKSINFLEFIILPFYYKGVIFQQNENDKLRFSADHADINIVFDEDELLALSCFSDKPVYLASHPADTKNSQLSINKSRILVLFSGCLSKEMETSDLIIWKERILELSFLTKVLVFDLRIHPRTKPSLYWPKKLLKELESLGLTVSLQDGLTYSLPKALSNSIGVIGAPSSALRMARLLRKDIFVLGLPNSQDHGPDDQSWILGKANGIYWLLPNEKIKPDILIPKPYSNPKDISTVVELVTTSLYKSS